MKKTSDNKFVSLYIDNLELLQAGVADFVNHARTEAIESFNLLDIPDKKVEKYKYTNLKEVFSLDYEKYFAPSHAVNLQSSDVFKCNIPDLDTYKIYVVNGFFYGEQSLVTNDNGVVCGSFAAATRQYPDLVRKYYNSQADNSSDAVTALNTAFAQDGVFIYLPANTVLDKPIQIINILKGTEDAMVQGRNLFIFEENVQAKIIVCDHTLSSVKFLANSVTEISVGQSANVELVCVKNEHNDTAHVSSYYVEQQAKSVFTSNNITLHGGLVRNNISIKLVGEHCENHTYGLTLADSKQHIDNHTFVHHAVPNCMSNELVKSVVDGEAISIFNGRILVQQDAQKTLAFQQNNNLLLSADAKAYTKPQLEIYADDVKCSHGATVGQLNEEALFYMRSRGIGEKEARLLQMSGFVYEVLEKLSIDILRERISELVNKRLSGELNHCDGCDFYC